MMRNLFIASTLLFWLAVAGFWGAGFWFTVPVEENNRPLGAPQYYSLAVVAAHNQADDCWMAIDGSVYDFTSYLPKHPAPPTLMLDWCGKEASQAFRTKTRGRAHSAYAVKLLPQYRIGELREE